MVFQPDFFWIARLDRETRDVRVGYSMAGEAPARSLTFPLGRGIASRVIETEQPLLVADTAQDPRLREIDPIVVEPKIRSILAVPLFVEKKVVGVLSVQSFRANAYGERQIQLLATIAQQAAIALENARHHQIATVDSLTGLYQRDYFTQRMGEEYHRSSRYGTPFSVLMLDLDSFKKINDRFGHMAGDRFLREIGTLVRSSLRGADIPCRFGGEEFCALLPETDLAGARAIAERLRSDIGALQLREGAHYLGTTVSIGIACYPLHFEGSVSGLLQKADEALYRAKREGKDRVVVADA
jgi:diguanylate cyclase (GGDEF)-like protein